MIRKVEITILWVITLILAVSITANVVENTVVEIPIERVITRTIPVYETVYQDKPVFQEVEVEVVKEIPIKARYFESVGELELWVNDNHGLITVGAASLGTHDPFNDCEDQAERWQLEALQDGYLVSTCPVYYGRVFDMQVEENEYKKHVGLWTSIGNRYYYWNCFTGNITEIKGTVRD